MRKWIHWAMAPPPSPQQMYFYAYLGTMSNTFPWDKVMKRGQKLFLQSSIGKSKISHPVETGNNWSTIVIKMKRLADAKLKFNQELAIVDSKLINCKVHRLNRDSIQTPAKGWFTLCCKSAVTCNRQLQFCREIRDATCDYSEQSFSVEVL